METKYIVNNATGQTINGDLTINGNVVITGTTNTRPYKVYTALLTQTGNTNPDSFNGGELIVGTSYQLQSPSIDADFTNVGAPNNNDGTWFIATGTTPNNWGSGTVYCNYGAPVATVLENTIGNIWFNYIDTGFYRINSNELFIEDKSWYTPVIISNTANLTNGLMVWRNKNEIRIVTVLDGVRTDGLLFSTPIEISVYN